MNVKRVLVPTDFSDCSQHAMEPACAIAQRFGAVLELLHVVEPIFEHVNVLPVDMIDDLRPNDFYDQVRESAVARLREVAEGLAREGLEIETLVDSGVPADVICARAGDEGADMVVIATHGRRGVRRALFGSTAEEVVREAPCPVLVVRAED